MMASKFPSATAKSMDDLAALNDDHVRDMVEQLLVDDGGDGSNTAKPSDAIDPTNNKSSAPKSGDEDASPGGFLVTSGGLPQAPLSGSPNGQHQHSMQRGGHQQPVDNWSFASCPPMFAVCHGGPRDISPGTVTPPPQRSAHSTSPGYQPGQPGQLGVSFDVASPEFGNNGSFPSGPVGGYRGASPAPQPHHPQSAQSQGQSGHSQSQPQPAACTTSEGVTVLPLDKRLFEIPRVKSAQPDNAASLVKLFVGNMRFEMTREALRWVLHQASGIHIPLTHILVHVRAASSAGHVSTGCASVFVPEHEAEALLAMNQRIFCNSHSLYLAPSTHAMSRMIDERQILDHDHKGRKLRGPKNSMVIERSKSTPTPSQFTTPNNSFATMFSMGESPMHSTNASFANPFSSPGGLVMGGTPQSSHGNLTQLGFGASGTDYYGGGGGGTRSPGFGGFEGPGTHGYGHHQDAVAAAMAAHGHDSSSAGSPNGAHAYAHGHDSSPNGPTSTGAGAGDDDVAEVEGKDGRGKSGSPPMPQDAPNYERYPISLDQPSTTGAKISDAVELFIGGIRYEATASFVAWMLRAAVKRVSGNIVEIHPDHVTLFTNSKKKRNNNAGCALVKVERAHAEGLLALNHCILCDAYGAYYATTEDSMTKFIHAYHGKVRGGPSHAVVIETRKNVVNNARQGNAGAFGAAFGVRTFGAGFAQHGGGGAGGPASTGGVNASAASFTPGAGGASGVPSGAPSFDHNGGSAAAHSANGGPAVGASGINWSASAQNAHAGVSPGGGGGGGSVSWNPAWVPVYQGGGGAGSSPNEGHHHHLGQGQAPAVPQLVPAAAAGGGSPLGGLQSQSLSTNASFTGATVAATAAASTTIMGAAPPPPSYRSEAASSPSPDAKKKKAEEQ